MSPHGILGRSAGFDAFQRAVGAPAAKRRFVREGVRARPGERVLDVGCGTGALLEFFDAGVRYLGIDLSREYIATARRRHGDRGEFVCIDAADYRPAAGEAFDIAVAFGFFHHLDDDAANAVFAMLRSALEPSGRLLVCEPARTAAAGRVEQLLIRHDRGRFIRAPADYQRLAAASFPHASVRLIREELRVPYTFAVLDARLGS